MFSKAYRAAGNRFDLRVWSGQKHGFYHFGNTKHFIEVCRASDEFLVSLELIEGEPTIDAFARRHPPLSR